MQPNWLDRLAAEVSPQWGVNRLRSRYAFAMSGGYEGGRKTRRALSDFNPPASDADSASLPDIEVMRERSRDLVRNAPLAGGAINTKVTSVVGGGIKPVARVDRDTLGLDEDAADALERQIDREWALWADSPECDAERTLSFYDMQALGWRTVLESGDAFVTMPFIERSGSPYGLKLQLFEADRVSNPNWSTDTDTLAGGIERDQHGAPVRYHFSDRHPGSWVYRAKGVSWRSIDAFGAQTGRRNVLHLYSKLRPGQSRGIPDLAPIIELMKQLDRYTDAEIDAAVVSAMLTVFIKSESGETSLAPMQPTSEVGGKGSDDDFRLASGAILSLASDESVDTVNPGRPNQAFDGFVLAILRQVGVQLELPFELLVKHFTASYSAAQAALLEAWRFFMARREWLVRHLCRPVREAWMVEAVARGRIVAPGFLSGDPIIRRAYLGAEWIGPPKGTIDEVKSVTAARMRIEEEISTRQDEAAAMGKDWDRLHPQRAKEERQRREDETNMQVVTAQAATMNPPETDDDE